MKVQYIYTLLLCAILSICAVACDDDANDWAVNPDYEAPFRPTGFGGAVSATAVELIYKGVTNADQYIFEFSEGDSLLFNNIVRTETILADTLTVYNDNVAPTKREYRTLFENLKGTTRYSVRMKAIDKDNRETGYVQLCFDTPAEQVIIWKKPSIDEFTVQWDIQRPINKILYGVYTEQPVEGGVEGEVEETTVFETYELTDAEQVAGVATITELLSGTRYSVRVMLDDQVRGSASIQTTGLPGITPITINETTNINDLLRAQVAAGVRNVVLKFPLLSNGKRYEIGQINVPDGITTLHFIGDSRTTELPKVFLHAVRLEGLMQGIRFYGLNMDAEKNSSSYFFNIDNTAKYFKYVFFDNCEISNISRSLVRINAAIDVDSFVVQDCVIYNVAVGGYGFYNTGNAGMTLKNFTIRNTTMREIGDQMGDVQGTHESVTMSNVTFCNYTTGLPKLFRWRNAPTEMVMLNNIFTGTNKDATLDATADAKFAMDFTSCYKTNEWTWKTYAFEGITEVDMSGEELFVDPLNGDFHIKEGVRFAGANKAGDPRWWGQ